MAAKLDFLKDVQGHPHTTGGESAARLDVPEATVLEAFRRARRQGLIQGDGGRPEKFVLTEAGMQQLRVLSGEENPKPGISASVEAKLSELEERVNDTVEDVKGIFGLVDRVLQAKRPPSPKQDDLLDELQQENTDLQTQLRKQAVMFEFYALRLASEFSDGLTNAFEERANKLGEELDSETQESVRRLVELENQLDQERRRLFGPNRDNVRNLQGEIAALREKLGFSIQASKDAGEEEGEEAE